MALSNENYKGSGNVELCPLCEKNNDLQESSFKCPKVLEKIDINEDYEEIVKPFSWKGADLVYTKKFDIYWKRMIFKYKMQY